MKWANVTKTQTEEEWFKDYVHLALASPPPPLPPAQQHIGATTVTWFETEPGVAFIHTIGGTVDDRTFAEIFMREALVGHGIRQAQYTFDQEEDFRKTAHWDDDDPIVMRKA